MGQRLSSTNIYDADEEAAAEKYHGQARVSVQIPALPNPDPYRRVTLFRTKEIFFLWNYFHGHWGGELEWEAFAAQSEWVCNNPVLFKAVFAALDGKGNGTLDFRDFIVAASIISRQCLEDQISLLFDIFSYGCDFRQSVTKAHVGKMVALVQKAFGRVRRPSAEAEVSFECELDDMLALHGEDRISRAQFVRLGISSGAMCFCLQLVEAFLLPVVFNMDNKLNSSVFNIPLHYMCRKENRTVPLALAKLCGTIAQRVVDNPSSMTELATVLQDYDPKLVEALEVSLDLDIDFEPVSLGTLMRVLRRYLKFLPAPMFSYSLSDILIRAASESMDDIVAALDRVSKAVPLNSYDVLQYFLSFLRSLSNCDHRTVLRLANLYATSIVRSRDDKANQMYRDHIVTAVAFAITDAPMLFPARLDKEEMRFVTMPVNYEGSDYFRYPGCASRPAASNRIRGSKDGLPVIAFTDTCETDETTEPMPFTATSSSKSSSRRPSLVTFGPLSSDTSAGDDQSYYGIANSVMRIVRDLADEVTDVDDQSDDDDSGDGDGCGDGEEYAVDGSSTSEDGHGSPILRGKSPAVITTTVVNIPS